MNTYYFTFGMEYAQDSHPSGLYVHPNGWVEVKANSEFDARVIMVKTYSNKWAFCYKEDEFDKSFFPLGCINKLGEE